MAKLRLFCESCGATEFNIQKDTEHNSYDCTCADCGKYIATMGGYGIAWVKEDTTDESNPTA